MERIGADWRSYEGHVARYRSAAESVREQHTVKDVACGVGYGAALISCHRYIGYDKPEVIGGIEFPGQWVGCDLNDPAWWPVETDVTLSFETLEHLEDPARVAAVLAESTRHLIIVSVPSVRSVGINPYHLHDFTGPEVPPLFVGFDAIDEWHQAEEQTIVWWLMRA
jgi:hypothetical protein